MLLDRVDEALRSARFVGQPAECSEQRPARRHLRRLRIAPIKPERAAIRPIMSGVRNCIMYETRLVAIGNLRFLDSKSSDPLE